MSENQDHVLSGRKIVSNLVGICLREYIDEVMKLERGNSFTYSGPIDSGNRLFVKCTFTRGKSDDLIIEVDAVFDGEKVLRAVMSAEASTTNIETYVPGEWEALIS